MKPFQMLLFLKRTQRYEIGTVSKRIDVAAQKQKVLDEPTFKCRHVVALIGFIVFMFMNIHRMNMSVSIVAMVNSKPAGLNHSSPDSCPVPLVQDNATEHPIIEERYKKFDWSPEIQGYILASGFIGYFLTQLIGGVLSETFGSKRSIVWGLFMASVSTLITPVAAQWNVYLLILVQTIRGMAQGLYLPAFSVLAADWFPVMERGSLFAFTLSGNAAGAMAGGLLSGFLCDETMDATLAGWPSVFYLCGALGIVAALLIAIFLHESPSTHPNVSKAELSYILNNQETKLLLTRPEFPWRSVFTSVPMYALAIGFAGPNWCGAQFMSVHSTFLGTILHFPIAQNGLLSSIPFLLQTIFALAASGLSKIMDKHPLIGVDRTRKFWNFVGSFGYSICMLGIYFAGCNGMMSVFFSFAAMAFVGFSFAGCLIVPADMTPTFAGSVMGIASTVGTSAAFLLPITLGYLTEGRQTLEQWNKFLFISIAVVMSSAIVFCIFGSAEVQPWNRVPKDNEGKRQTNPDPEKQMNSTAIV